MVEVFQKQRDESKVGKVSGTLFFPFVRTIFLGYISIELETIIWGDIKFEVTFCFFLFSYSVEMFWKHLKEFSLKIQRKANSVV